MFSVLIRRNSINRSSRGLKQHTPHNIFRCEQYSIKMLSDNEIFSIFDEKHNPVGKEKRSVSLARQKCFLPLSSFSFCA